MYIEDLILELDEFVPTMSHPNNWDVTFIDSICYKMHEAQSNNKEFRLSQNQAKEAIKLINKFKKILISRLDVTDELLENAISNPVFKNELYTSPSRDREVRYLGENKIGFRFKYNKFIIDQIKFLDNSSFNKTYAMWIIPVIKSNINHVLNVIHKNKFNMDAYTEEWLVSYRDHVEEMNSSFRYDEESDLIIVSVHNNDDQLKSWIRYIAQGELL